MKKLIALALLVVTTGLGAQQLPSPGIDSAEVEVESAPTANYFELSHFDTSNRDGGIVVEVWWNAYMKTVVADDPNTPDVDEASKTKTLVKNMGPATFSDAGLVTVAADALARAKSYETAGQPAGLAYMLGQRDAIYAALQAAGLIPGAAQ